MRIKDIDTKVLHYLEDNAYRIVTKDELLEKVWEGNSKRYNTVTACIHRLRKSGHRVITKFTLGYIIR